jgi:hypothetical protein
VRGLTGPCDSRRTHHRTHSGCLELALAQRLQQEEKSTVRIMGITNMVTCRSVPVSWV